MAVRMSADYAGALHCVLEHGPSGARLETDAPTDNMGRGESFSPTDLVGAGLLSCAITTMAIRAEREGLVFDGASGRVTKEMTSEAPRRIAALTVEIDLPSGLEPAERERVERWARTCPVALSLAGEMTVAMRFRYAG